MHLTMSNDELDSVYLVLTMYLDNLKSIDFQIYVSINNLFLDSVISLAWRTEDPEPS